MVASIHVRSLRPVGGLLMLSGLSYDSDAGRQIAGSLTAIMSGVSYATSVGHRECEARQTMVKNA